LVRVLNGVTRGWHERNTILDLLPFVSRTNCAIFYVAQASVNIFDRGLSVIIAQNTDSSKYWQCRDRIVSETDSDISGSSILARKRHFSHPHTRQVQSKSQQDLSFLFGEGLDMLLDCAGRKKNHKYSVCLSEAVVAVVPSD
jgi:hypothetical protein